MTTRRAGGRHAASGPDGRIGPDARPDRRMRRRRQGNERVRLRLLRSHVRIDGLLARPRQFIERHAVVLRRSQLGIDVGVLRPDLPGKTEELRSGQLGSRLVGEPQQDFARGYNRHLGTRQILDLIDVEILELGVLQRPDLRGIQPRNLQRREMYDPQRGDVQRPYLR